MAVRRQREVIIAPVSKTGGIANAADKSYVESITESKVQTGTWTGFWPYASTGTVLYAANQARLMRVYLSQAITEVAVEVSTGGATTVAVVFYTDTGTAAGTLVAQTAAIDVSTNGIKTATVSVTTPGYYWVGIYNLTATTVTMRTLVGHNPYSVGQSTPLLGQTLAQGNTYTGVPTTPPGTMSAPTGTYAYCGVIYYKAA